MMSNIRQRIFVGRRLPQEIIDRLDRIKQFILYQKSIMDENASDANSNSILVVGLNGFG